MSAMPSTLADAAPLPPGIVLRPETEDDLGFLRQLYLANRWNELIPLPWPIAAKVQFLHDQFDLQRRHFRGTLPDADFLVVEREAAPAPVGRLYLDRGGTCWRVVDIALVSAEQGAGLGGGLLRWTIAAARGAGAEAVDLHVGFDNPRAERLYRRLGFVDAASAYATHRRLIHTVGGEPS
jgi:GNAT superfamily N-acetyltransferase